MKCMTCKKCSNICSYMYPYIITIQCTSFNILHSKICVQFWNNLPLLQIKSLYAIFLVQRGLSCMYNTQGIMQTRQLQPTGETNICSCLIFVCKDTSLFECRQYFFYLQKIISKSLYLCIFIMLKIHSFSLVII